VEIRPGSRHTGARTSSADAVIGSDGSATYRFDLTWDLDLDLTPNRYSLIHVGSIGAQLPPGADAV
jgi:fructokinase